MNSSVEGMTPSASVISLSVMDSRIVATGLTRKSAVSHNNNIIVGNLSFIIFGTDRYVTQTECHMFPKWVK